MIYRNYTFEDYYREMQKALKYLLYKFKGLKTPTEDVEQELYILIWQNVDKLNAIEVYKPYCRQMLYYTLLQILIKEHKDGLWVTGSTSFKNESEEKDIFDFVGYNTDFLYLYEDPFLVNYKKIRKERDHERYERIKNDPEYKKRVSEYAKEYYSRPDVKERRREYMREYYSRPDVKEKRREYEKRPEVKERRRERQKEYCSRPEVKEKRRMYMKEYNSRDEIREKQKEYYSRPEAKEKKKEYMKEYASRPETKKKRREYYEKKQREIKRISQRVYERIS